MTLDYVGVESRNGVAIHLDECLKKITELQTLIEEEEKQVFASLKEIEAEIENDWMIE